MKLLSAIRDPGAAAPNGTQPRPRPVSTVVGALWGEFEAIHGKQEGHETGRGPDADLQAYYEAAHGREQAALCLSGGGIRSASFALGVLQALAHQGLLTKFHYLSTVSGGGFIGGWLMAMLAGHGGDAAKVQELLKAQEAPTELRKLRQYTNYLAPSTGLFSPDIWAGVTLWVRNVLVNWLIFFPALLALALLPLFYADVINALQPGWLASLLLVVALLGLGISVYNGADLLPSHVAPDERRREADRISVPVRVILPSMIWAALVPVIAGPWLRPLMPPGALGGDAIPLLAFLVAEGTALTAAWRRGLRGRVLVQNLIAWTIAALASSAMLWLWLDLALATAAEAAGLVAVLGPLAVASSHLVLVLVFVALRKEALRGDLDREWLARLSGEKILPSLIWALFAAVCLLLPDLVLNRWTSSFKPFLIWFWMAAGPIAAYVGKISKDMPGAAQTASGFKPSLALITDAVALLFGICLFMLLGALGAHLTGRGPWADLIFLALGLLLAWALGRRINVNRFSMHAVYRTRLVRGFLGSVRQDRDPDPFTGIDPLDNPRLKGLFNRGSGLHTLFPVVNATLNLVSTSNAAWKERRAESFTMTPLACGGAYLRRSEDTAAGYPARGAYVPTRDYAGDETRDGDHERDGGTGLSLGTAMTISGAAVSPNMGYHSSPATAFLMTLFNVRLGAWLPNPAVASRRELIRARPPNAVISLAREVFGLTNDRGRDVYLSDGGHFENLGLYEMVRRRCHYILVVDAGMDGGLTFEDLGNAIRKIRVDLDVRIVFDPPLAIGVGKDEAHSRIDFACATIRYPETEKVGRLIYLKPCRRPDMPIDVRAYANQHAEFPHESTVDQFFSESQFESYRRLGEAEAAALIGGASTMPGFFNAALKRIKSPPKRRSQTT